LSRLLSWLKTSPLYPKLYWESREGNFALAGCGPSSTGTEYSLAWQPFCSRESAEWAGFNACGAPLNMRVSLSSEMGQPLPFSSPRILHSHQLPDRAGWIRQIESALRAIREGELDKVVLAKRVELCCDSQIDALALFSALRRPGQTNFFLQPTAKSAFLGSSPERLYKREGQIIVCDAMAGTRLLNAGNELLQSPKDLREFQIVQERIVEALRPLCLSPPEVSPLSLVHTPTVSHLHTSIRGELQDGVNDSLLLEVLHPTPAVGGWPKNAAREWLATHEPFVRGLYAAPIGYFSEKRSEFAVGIRSCLIQESRAYLYAGTGIVEGSDAHREWEESEQKLMQWRSLFHE